MPHHGEAQTDGPVPFARKLLEHSAEIHRRAERRPFMVAFFKAQLPKDAYVAWLGRLYSIYEALEATDERLRNDPVCGSMYSPELHRTASLETDLRFFLGDDWRSAVVPSPATKSYVDRIAQLESEWPPGYVAHQWLRYLGQVLAQDVQKRLVRKAYGLAGADGVAFYDFPDVGDPRAYLRAYHARLNALPLDEDGQMLLAEEGSTAFGLNIELSDELAAEFGIGDYTEEETEALMDELNAEHP